MLKTQDKDAPKLVKLFKEIFNTYGGPDYIIKYSNENDRMLGAFCRSVIEISEHQHVSVERSIKLCHTMHVNMPEGDLLFEPTDDEEEIRRKNKVAEEVYKRVILGQQPEPEAPRRRGLLERILSFLRRYRAASNLV